MAELKTLAGAVALVTGGADGIGFGLARALGRRGATPVLLDLRAEALSAAIARLAEEDVAADGVTCEISDPAALEAAAATVAERHGALSILWCNAGVGIAGGVLTAKPRALEWLRAVNIEGTVNTVRAFMPLLRAGTGVRRIGFTSSSNTLGRIPAPGLAAYAASKWAMTGLAEAITAEVAGDGITTTIFCPGLLDTDIWNGGRARPERFGGPVELPHEVGERWRREGMPVDWACEAGVAALVAGQPYCAPVDPHSVADFEARVAAIRAGFVLPTPTR